MLKKIGGFVILCTIVILASSCSSTNVAKSTKELENDRWSKVKNEGYQKILADHKSAQAGSRF